MLVVVVVVVVVIWMLVVVVSGGDGRSSCGHSSGSCGSEGGDWL